MARYTKAQRKKDQDLLTRVKERFQAMYEADEDNRREALEDMKFANVPGYQWDENMKKERGKRPCYEFNKIRVTGKRIINDQRTNRPSGKTRGVEGGDKETAEIYDGLIRNIWNISDGDTVVDYAAEYQVFAGMGAWRVVTEYSSDTAFDQDIKVEAIPNPFTLFADNAAKDILKKDARDWILTEKIAREAFEKKYGEEYAAPFEDHEYDDDDEWENEDEVRIAEYWWKEPITKEIWQVQGPDGRMLVIDSESEEAVAVPEKAIVRRRQVDTHKIMMCIVSGNAILEPPKEWAGTIFPFVQMYGEYQVIDGKVRWCGITRWAKDAQRSYNVSRTAITETIAMAPQAKWWATTEQAKGNTDKWAEAHQKNFPFLLYNPDPKAQGAPQRMGGADVPAALIQESQLASEEINMVTGIYQHDIGGPNAAKSGRQELARINQGAIATFNYQDNAGKAMKLTFEILIDLIPRIYDTEREIRVLGSDGVEDYTRINTIVVGSDGRKHRLHDLSEGKYDVTVTVGPSFSTRRQEAADTYQSLMQANPDIFGVAGDLIFKSMDLPYAEDIAERLKTLLPPPIQQLINEDQPVPPEVQAMMQQAEQAMAMVEEQAAAAQQMINEAEISKSEAEEATAKLQTEKARFEAFIAKEMSKVVVAKAEAETAEVKGSLSEVVANNTEIVENERLEMSAQLAAQFAQSIDAINGLAAAFTGQAIETMDKIQEKPRIVKIEQKRENGKLVAVPVYEE